jgi:mannan endo-1,4-beta-mannosidase
MKAKQGIIRLAILATALIIVVSGCGSGSATTNGPTAVPTPAPCTPDTSSAASPFVTASDGKFVLGGCPYYFVGANFWQGMELGVDGPTGNRGLLVAELDRLQELGVTNLRIMASSEGPNTEPYRMVPALMISPGVYDESVLEGLDYLLAQMGQRNMKAVMVLNNYWQWSGGMGQYVSWHEHTPIPYPGDYGTFMDYVSQFYSCQECQTWYRNHIETIITHTNPYTGLKYRDDPTVFSWELANEPRRYPDSWIDDTAAYITSLDPNHMVTTGSEGTPPGERIDFVETHNGPNIDYATIHIWPQNWGWYDPRDSSTYDTAEVRAIIYFQNAAADARLLNKPLVLEEFGLARDWEPLHDIYDPDSPTTYRNRFYTAMFDQVFKSVMAGGPAGGDNFWAWSGRSRPGAPWVGDPPHETPGWYSVYQTDESTQAIISAHAEQLAQLQK